MFDQFKQFFKEPLKGIVVFSAIETAAVVGWLALVWAGHPFLAALFLLAGYVVEHVVAFNVGQDRPYLAWPKRKGDK